MKLKVLIKNKEIKLLDDTSRQIIPNLDSKDTKTLYA